MKLIKSFSYALKGVVILLVNERNAQIELVCTLLVLFTSYLLQISSIEWLFVLLCCFGVLSAEAFNTSLEKTLDHIHPEKHPSIAVAKDLAAGAVLLMAVFSLFTAIIIFTPYLKDLLA